MAYVDDEQIGSCTSLVAPHEYDLGTLTPGKNRLSIRIDNRTILPYRPLKAACTGCVQVDRRPARHEWNFWVYPSQVPDTVLQDVLITSAWPEAEARLATGGKALFQPKAQDLDSVDPRISTVPVFWNRLMNPGGAWMLGLWCDKTHPALAGLPTEVNCDWQWVDLLGGVHALNLDTLPRASADCAADRRLKSQR